MSERTDKQDQQRLKIEVARKRAQAKANIFAEVFGNPQGVEVLQEIKEQFDVPVICVEQSHETIIRAAQRDVVRWIEEVIIRGQKNAVEG